MDFSYTPSVTLTTTERQISGQDYLLSRSLIDLVFDRELESAGCGTRSPPPDQ